MPLNHPATVRPRYGKRLARIQGMTLRRWGGLLVSSLALNGLIHSAQLGAQEQTAAKQAARLDDTARTAFIRSAQVWSPTNIPSMDLRAGPDGGGAFPPNQMVTCTYVEGRQHGSSRKFACAMSPGDVVKIRYGVHNQEVQASVLATRLLWALGFAADRVYPVRVRCKGCPSDPWQRPGRVREDHVFAPAVIERHPEGDEVTDEGMGGASPAQRDALKLLAVFMQHTDTKREQQRLLCLPGGLAAGGRCVRPFLVLHDVGLTFGHANTFNRTGSGSVDLDKWANTPVWKDPGACV